MKTLKFMCLTFCAFLMMFFSACSGALSEPAALGGSLSFNLSEVLNHYSSNSRSSIALPSVSQSKEDLSDLTDEERELYNIICENLRYKATVSLIQQDGFYNQSISKEAPFTDDPEPEFFTFELKEIPVGILAVLHVDIHFEGKEDVEKALTSYVRENMGIPDADDKYVQYIIRTYLGKDFDFTIEGDSEPILIVAGNNPVKVKIMSNQGDFKEGSTGIQIGLTYNTALRLAWKDESDDSSFRLIIKMA